MGATPVHNTPSFNAIIHCGITESTKMYGSVANRMQETMESRNTAPETDKAADQDDATAKPGRIPQLMYITDGAEFVPSTSDR